MMRIGCAVISVVLLLSAGALADPKLPSEQVVEWLYDTYTLDSEWNEVEVLTELDENCEPGAIVDVDRPLSQKEPLGLFTLLVDIFEGDGPPRQAQVRLRVRRFADVLVASDRITRFDPVDESALQLERKDITNLREQPVTSVEEIRGLRYTRNLRRGTILTSRCVEAVPDLRDGAEVTIVYSSGPCIITALGKALESGYVGETVRVRSDASGKIIRAEVADGATVRLAP